jgi:hypothetical protein
MRLALSPKARARGHPSISGARRSWLRSSTLRASACRPARVRHRPVLEQLAENSHQPTRRRERQMTCPPRPRSEPPEMRVRRRGGSGWDASIIIRSLPLARRRSSAWPASPPPPCVRLRTVPLGSGSPPAPCGPLAVFVVLKTGAEALGFVFVAEGHAGGRSSGCSLGSFTAAPVSFCAGCLTRPRTTLRWRRARERRSQRCPPGKRFGVPPRRPGRPAA